ncbi:MAG: hypothetical protein EP329_02450 [Deltaproteobacteria bacterium]|nr:MAG: hypothetical protein EP329_02450 [Deltaproteobacteria bacterium]
MTDAMDAALRPRLARGEVIVTTEPVAGTTAPRIVVRAVIDAPPAQVWDLVDKSALYMHFMPRIKKSEELTRDGDDVRTRVTVEMPFPLKNLTATTQARHTVEPGVRWVRAWRLESGDYRFNEGSWTLTAFDGDDARTFAQYQVHVLPKIPIPKMIQSAVQEKAMPSMIEAVRGEVRRRFSR